MLSSDFFSIFDHYIYGHFTKFDFCKVYHGTKNCTCNFMGRAVGTGNPLVYNCIYIHVCTYVYTLYLYVWKICIFLEWMLCIILFNFALLFFCCFLITNCVNSFFIRGLGESFFFFLVFGYDNILFGCIFGDSTFFLFWAIIFFVFYCCIITLVF